MMKCQTVMDILERLAPKKMAEDWDNPGLLAGDDLFGCKYSCG